MFRHAITAVVLGVGLLALAGCDSRDPYMRTDVWEPTGANAANLAAMVANPEDLIVGRSGGAANASEPALAVTSIWQDHPKPLTAGGGGSSGGSGSGGGGGGSGGSGNSGG